jgi:hypothetical protein
MKSSRLGCSRQRCDTLRGDAAAIAMERNSISSEGLLGHAIAQPNLQKSLK